MATKTLSKLKMEMIFNTDLARLVDSMKGISAAQYHIMERKLTQLEKYSQAVDELFEPYDFRLSQHPFVRLKNQRKLICIVTTDSGFLGGLNMKVVQAAMGKEDADSHYLVVGERGATALREFGKSYTSLPGINIDDTRFELIENVISSIFKAFSKDNFGQAILVYPRSVAFSSQRVELLNLIPCPLFFRNRTSQVPTRIEQSRQVILESSEFQIIEYITALWLRKRLVECFESAKLSEFGARTMHLEDSFNTLTKIDKQLKLQYFKARREKIDQSLRETFTAQLMAK